MGQLEIEAINCLPARKVCCWIGLYRSGGSRNDRPDPQGILKSEERVLFWHTGRTPALFADVYQSGLSSADKGFQAGSKSAPMPDNRQLRTAVHFDDENTGTVCQQTLVGDRT